MESLAQLVRLVVMNTPGAMVEGIEVRPSRLVPSLKKVVPWLCIMVEVVYGIGIREMRELHLPPL